METAGKTDDGSVLVNNPGGDSPSMVGILCAPGSLAVNPDSRPNGVGSACRHARASLAGRAEVEPAADKDLARQLSFSASSETADTRLWRTVFSQIEVAGCRPSLGEADGDASPGLS